MLEGRLISLADFKKCYTMSSALEVNVSNCYEDTSRFLTRLSISGTAESIVLFLDCPFSIPWTLTFTNTVKFDSEGFRSNQFAGNHGLNSLSGRMFLRSEVVCKYHISAREIRSSCWLGARSFPSHHPHHQQTCTVTFCEMLASSRPAYASLSVRWLPPKMRLLVLESYNGSLIHDHSGLFLNLALEMKFKSLRQL